MSEHGNGADGDAVVLSVLPGILPGLACWSWRLCPGDSSVGHRQLAIHDGRQALGALPAPGACTRPWTPPAPSGTWAPRAGPAGQVKGFGEPHRNPTTPRHGA